MVSILSRPNCKKVKARNAEGRRGSPSASGALEGSGYLIMAVGHCLPRGRLSWQRCSEIYRAARDRTSRRLSARGNFSRPGKSWATEEPRFQERSGPVKPKVGRIRLKQGDQLVTTRRGACSGSFGRQRINAQWNKPLAAQEMACGGQRMFPGSRGIQAV